MKNQKPLRVAIIGLGEWGRCHVETYASLAGIEVVAVCDGYAPRLEEIATQYGIEARYTDAGALWERDDIDLVSVVTPENQHLSCVVSALQSGKHVLVEKAVATNAEDAYVMQKAADETGHYLVPGHILRFDSRYAEVKRHLENNAIGDVISILSRRSRPQSQFAHHGRNHTVFVQMPHDIDQAIWWAGSRVRTVRAIERHIPSESRVVDSAAPDLLWATLEFENGIVAVLQSSWLLPEAAHIDMHDQAEVIGTKGMLNVQTANHGFEWWNNNRESSGRYAPDLGIHHHLNGRIVGALREELSYFCDCIRREAAPIYTSFSDAVHGVEVAEAIIKSAATGEIITMNNKDSASV